jgi:hypothetical protein
VLGAELTAETVSGSVTTPATYASTCSGFYRDRLDEAQLALNIDAEFLAEAEDMVKVFADDA